MIETVNPATEELIARYDHFSSDQINYTMRMADSAFASWKHTSFADRSSMLLKVAANLRRQSEELSNLMTAEMGKPITQSRSEIEKCALGCEYYAENGEAFLSPEPLPAATEQSRVRYEPIGAVLAVMPWNFPFWQVIRFAAPTLMAGNVCLLKHASNVTGCALAIERIFRESELPTGCLQALVIPSRQVSRIIQFPLVQAVTLTGSEGAGRDVAAQAGRQLKKTVLELGGSDPFIVLKDAPIEEVAKKAVRARTLNSGQSCIAAKRFIVQKEVVGAFTQAFVREMKSLKTGDPMDESTDIGPLAREEFLIELHDQAQLSLRAGAKLLCGGDRIDRPGYFYQPTVLGDVVPEMSVFREETFGPLAAITTAEDEKHMIWLANETPFGLGASIWTADTEHGISLTPRINAGNVFVNEITKSDPGVPFGGVKASGYGRELSSFGIREFVNAKTVWVG